MTSIETLEDILHREKMAEPLPEFNGQTQDEWNEEYNKIIDSIPFGDYKGTITDYGERKIRPILVLERLNFQEAQLIRAKKMLILMASYPIALLIFICWVINWA